MAAIRGLLGWGVLQRWIIRTLIKTTFSIGGILTFLIWMVQSLRFTIILSYQSMTLIDIIQLCLGMVPRTLVVVVPMAFSGALIFIWVRSLQDKEVLGAESFGASLYFFVKPALAAACVFTVGLYGIQEYISPRAVFLAKERESEMRYNLDPSFITPGVFFQLEKRVFYVHRQKSRYVYEGLFLCDESQKDREIFLTGRQARVVKKERGFALLIQDGTYQECFSSGKAPYLAHFSKYTLTFNPPDPLDRVPSVQERSLGDLFEDIKTAPEKLFFFSWRWGFGQGKDGNKLEREKNTDLSFFACQEFRQRIISPCIPLFDSFFVTWMILAGGGTWMTCLKTVLLVGFSHLIMIKMGYVDILFFLLSGLSGWLFWCQGRKNKFLKKSP